MEMNKLNLFTKAPPIQAAAASQAIGGHSAEGVTGSSKSNNNPFGSNMVGVNANIGVGDMMDLPAQLGRKAGQGRTLGFG